MDWRDMILKGVDGVLLSCRKEMMDVKMREADSTRRVIYPDTRIVRQIRGQLIAESRD